MSTTPNNRTSNPTRSIRVPDDVWEKAKRRAASEGVSMSRAAVLIIEGYAGGYLDLPRVTKTYKSTGG